MAISLQQRVCALTQQAVSSYRAAWLVWCDPRRDWPPLLQRTAENLEQAASRRYGWMDEDAPEREAEQRELEEERRAVLER